MTTTSPGAAPVQFPLTFGLDTFGDVTHDEDDRPLSHAQTIRNIVETSVRSADISVVKTSRSRRIAAISRS